MRSARQLRARLVGVVLAGGSGSRLGQPKGALMIDGVPLAERAARALEPLCDEVLIGLRPGVANPSPSRRTVHDEPPLGRGPLAGLQAAWSALSIPADLLVLACDYPRVDTGVLRVLTEACSVEADVRLWTDSHGRDHPLVALWRSPARAVVEAALASGEARVGGALERLRVLRLSPADLPGRALDPLLLNVNTPAELAALEHPSFDAG